MSAYPTATQKLALAHELAASTLSEIPGLGLVATDQSCGDAAAEAG